MFAGGTVRSNVFQAVLLGGIAVVAIAGCTSGPTSPSDGGTTTAAPVTSASKSEIASPLDISKFSGDTCSGLTDSQIAPYMAELRNKQQQAGDNGPICTFMPKNPLGPTVTIGVQNTATPTQDSLYDSLSNFSWREKIPAVSGYPAANASTAGNSTGGDCETVVAVNEKQNLYVQFSDTSESDPNYAKPCTVSNSLVAAMIQNIQAGGA